jgi:hypothetical protein
LCGKFRQVLRHVLEFELPLLGGIGEDVEGAFQLGDLHLEVGGQRAAALRHVVGRRTARLRRRQDRPKLRQRFGKAEALCHQGIEALDRLRWREAEFESEVTHLRPRLGELLGGGLGRDADPSHPPLELGHVGVALREAPSDCVAAGSGCGAAQAGTDRDAATAASSRSDAG